MPRQHTDLNESTQVWVMEVYVTGTADWYPWGDVEHPSRKHATMARNQFVADRTHQFDTSKGWEDKAKRRVSSRVVEVVRTHVRRVVEWTDDVYDLDTGKVTR